VFRTCRASGVFIFLLRLKKIFFLIFFFSLCLERREICVSDQRSGDQRRTLERYQQKRKKKEKRKKREREREREREGNLKKKKQNKLTIHQTQRNSSSGRQVEEEQDAACIKNLDLFSRRAACDCGLGCGLNRGRDGGCVGWDDAGWRCCLVWNCGG